MKNQKNGKNNILVFLNIYIYVSLYAEERDHFNWFDHSWSHQQAHHYNTLNGSSQMREHMLLNYRFACDHRLHTDTFYAVSPHHSGIYPVDERLYAYWSDLWLIRATSTDLYPHLRPYSQRRGFVHRATGIMVVPRQTCGIYTHTLTLAAYPNGSEALWRMIDSGEIFSSLVYNRVLVYMTHASNYVRTSGDGSGRSIAQLVFERLFEHALKWTNVEFRTAPPLQLAQAYFDIHKEDAQPLWTNVCVDKRHAEMVSSEQLFGHCHLLPRLVIIGPQKTGEQRYIVSTMFSIDQN